MNSKKILLGISLAAVLTMAISLPLIAEAITPLKQTEIKVKNGEISKLRFHVNGLVPTQPFGGYAIFTDNNGAAIAVTSHAGFYDSETQTAPNAGQVALDPFPGPAAVCNVDNVACGPEWHTHLVEAGPNPYCSFAGINELTWDEPSESTKVAGQNLIMRHIALGDKEFIEALGGDSRDFFTGTPLEGGAAFDLNPVVIANAQVTNFRAVCIADPVQEEEQLCEEIDSAGSGLAFRDEYDFQGNPRLDTDEFPFSNDLFDEINTNQATALDASVVGGVELQTWFDANC